VHCFLTELARPHVGPDALRSWIGTAQEFGDPVPPPSRAQDETYSGRWNMRVPKSLHRRLAERAKAEGVSLNTLAVTLLAEGLGRRGYDDRHAA
jgi:antitoxin HicB